MPVRQRKPSEITQQVIPLLLLGIGLVTTNNSATFLDGESTNLGAASTPLRTILDRVLFRRRRARATSSLRSHSPFLAALDGRKLRLSSDSIHSFFSGGAFSAGPRLPPFGGFVVCRRCRHLGRGPMAGRFSSWQAGDLVLVFVFPGRWFDALLFQVSGRPDHWPLGGILFLLRLFDLDKLFRLGHSRVPRDRSGCSLASKRIFGNSESSPGNCGAVIYFFPSSLFRVPL